MAVVGGDERQAKIFFKLKKAGMDAVLHFQTLILNLKIEILFAEDVGEVGGRGARGGVVVLHQALGDFSLEASGEADQAARVFGKKLLAHTRLVVEAVQGSLRRDLDEIAVPFFVLGEHEQVVVGIALGRGAMVVLFSQPTMGFTPACLAALTKWTAPKILPWSVMATAGIPISLTRWQSFSTSQAPSSME